MSLNERQARAFRAFELAGWQRVVPAYDQGFSPLTAQAVEPLLDAAAIARPMTVLDVAAGPGHTAAAAAARGARAVGVDFSRAMTAAARRRHPGIAFHRADAEALPFPDRAFDAVVMNFGLLHLGRPERAAAEAHRVLRSGGRFAFTVWADQSRAAAFAILEEALRAHGRLDVPVPPGPPFFRFSDPGESARLLAGAGFAAARVTSVRQTWRLHRPGDLFEVLGRATVRTAALIAAQPAEALAAIRGAITEGARRHQRGAGIELPMPAVLAWAVRR